MDKSTSKNCISPSFALLNEEKNNPTLLKTSTMRNNNFHLTLLRPHTNRSGIGRLMSIFVFIFLLTSCDVCEIKGKVTFDNTERLWCNCEVTWQNGDVYVVDAGEMRTYEFYRGSHTFDVYCGNDAFGNDLCGFEEEIITRTYDIDCGDEYAMNLNF